MVILRLYVLTNGVCGVREESRMTPKFFCLYNWKNGVSNVKIGKARIRSIV